MAAPTGRYRFASAAKNSPTSVPSGRVTTTRVGSSWPIRCASAEEVAPTAVLLASDPGGNLYTGQTLGPNSGDVML